MAPNKKYLSLEEAAQQLGIKTDELIRMREKGDVRGFADRGTWKFKADDVEEFRRRRQPDSDPDLPIMDESDEDMGTQQTVIRRGADLQSDSDVRLSPSDVPKKKRLTGSSADMAAVDLSKSDSDVRLADAGPRAKSDSDSDVKLVKPSAASKTDSDSDVKMIDDLPPESDSDVKLLEPHKSLTDSDSDVRLSGSDSDVRLAPLLGSDSDVKLIGRKSKGLKSDSDSDVNLLPRKGSNKTVAEHSAKTDEDVDLISDDLLGDDDSSITLAGDSGIQLAGDSGIRLADDSGIRLSDDSGIRLSGGDSGIRLGGISGISGLRLGGDSGIRLADDSGVQLKKPADSGISLEGMDSGIKLADSGIKMGGDSGINLMSGSSAKGPKAGGSSKKLKGRKPGQDDLEATAPMMLSGLNDDDDLSSTSPLLSTSDPDDASAADLDQYNASDTSELASLGDSGHNVVMFDEDEEDAPPVTRRAKQKTVEESIFEMEDASEELEELEVSDDELSGDNEIDDLAFDDDGSELDESFSEGSSEYAMGVAQRVPVAQEVEWSGGFFTLLLASLAFLIIGSWMSADLLRVVWAYNEQVPVDSCLAGLLGFLWKK